MTMTNALKRMEKIGKVYQRGVPAQYHVLIGSHELTVSRNGGMDDVATIKVRSLGDRDEMVSDYSAGSFFDNLKQAIDAARRWNSQTVQTN